MPAAVAARRSQRRFGQATTFSGNSFLFCEFFFLFSLLAKRERVSVGAD
jgi:hypothetical protein